MKSTLNVVAAALLGRTSASLIACGDDDENSNPDSGQTPDAGDTGAGDTGAGVPAKKEVYAVASQVFSGSNEQTSYLMLHEGSLFEGTIGGQKIERVGRALTVTGPEAGSVFYAGDKSAEIDRYTVKNGKLEDKDTVTLAGEGVAAIAEYPGQLVFVSETKALYFDSRSSKVLVWNPKEMTLTKAIDVSSVKVENFSATFSTVTATKGDKVFMPVGYRTPAAVPSTTAVIVVDTTNDTAKVIKDTRCGYVRDAVEGDDGMWYLATEAFGSAVHHLNSSAAPAPCLLRFNLSKESFDETFKVDLNALAGGKTVGSLVKLPNGKVYTRILDNSKVPNMAMPSGRGVASAIA